MVDFEIIDFNINNNVKSELQTILKADFEIIIIHVIDDVIDKVCN